MGTIYNNQEIREIEAKAHAAGFDAGRKLVKFNDLIKGETFIDSYKHEHKLCYRYDSTFIDFRVTQLEVSGIIRTYLFALKGKNKQDIHFIKEIPMKPEVEFDDVVSLFQSLADEEIRDYLDL